MRPHRGPGRPAGVRNRLTKEFLTDVLASWQKHGAASLELLRLEDVAQYCRLVAGTLPKEMVIETAMGEMSDADLDEFIVSVKHHMLTRPGQPMKLIEGAINGSADRIATRTASEDAGTGGGDKAATRDRE